MSPPSAALFANAIHDVFQPKAQEALGQISSGAPTSTAQEDLILSVCGAAMFSGLQHFIQHTDHIPQAFHPCLDMFWEMMNPSTATEHDVVLQAAAQLQPPPKCSPVCLAKEAGGIKEGQENAGASRTMQTSPLDIINAQEEIYTELRDQAMALDHLQRQIEAAQARMRASEASVPLNMAYLPAIPDPPALHFKDLPQEMPEFVIDLI